jgi:hypothetical protein
MGHRDAPALEHGAQRREVEGEGVDQCRTARPCDLQEREQGVVRALAVELGVERVERLVDQLLDERCEGPRLGYPDRVGQAQPP